jgi:hypothetical protein
MPAPHHGNGKRQNGIRQVQIQKGGKGLQKGARRLYTILREYRRREAIQPQKVGSGPGVQKGAESPEYGGAG